MTLKLKYKLHDYFLYSYHKNWIIGEITNIYNQQKCNTPYQIMFKYQIVKSSVDIHSVDRWMEYSTSAFGYNSPMYKDTKKLEDTDDSTILALIL